MNPWVIVSLVLIAACGVLAVGLAIWKRNDELRSIFAIDEAAHEVTLAPAHSLTVVPDGFTCLRCDENPALPETVWCAVCAPIVDQYPAEPIERGGLR
jgi:hypothetical protein